MKNLKSRKAILLLLLPVILMFSGTAIAQLELEAYGHIGYTACDIDEWAGIGTSDWNQFMSGGYAQAWFLKFGNITVGGEFGYDYLLWYKYRVYDPYYTVYRSIDVDATRLMVVGRVPVGEKLFAEFGAGIYMFGDFTDFGLTGGLGYRIQIGDNLYVPIKLRIGVVLDKDTNLLPIGLSAGIGYTLGQ